MRGAGKVALVGSASSSWGSRIDIGFAAEPKRVTSAVAAAILFSSESGMYPATWA